jgi:hypothetical protein
MKARTNAMMSVTTLLLLVMVVTAWAQGGPQRLTLSISGFAGDVPLVRSQGRLLVDVQDVARLTNGSIRYEGGGAVLTLPCCGNSPAAADDKSHFSPGFTRASIEAMGSIREWGGMLMITVRNGYPVAGMAGETILAYQGRAADNVGLAAAAASTDTDRRGLELLRDEFNNVQAWSDEFIKSRSSMNAANLTTSPAGPMGDPEVGKLVECGQTLSRMFAAGRLDPDVVCR